MDEPLSDIQKHQLCMVARIGCSRATACKFIGASLAEVEAVLHSDAGFARQVAQAEAAAEVQFMGQVHKAAQDEKNWRTCVWWLDRRAREEEASAEATTGQLVAAVRAALEEFAKIIVTELPDAQRREAIMAQLLVIAEEAAAARDAPLSHASLIIAPTPEVLDGETGGEVDP